MNKLTIRIGNHTTKSLYALGNSFNMAHIIKVIDLHSTNLSDEEEMASDWKAVGMEVEYAIEQYGRDHHKNAIGAGSAF